MRLVRSRIGKWHVTGGETGQIAKLLEIGKRLEGLSRHASTHAAGVVIAPKPLLEIIPLYKSNKDEITTQYSMKDLETIGLLKMDFFTEK